MDREKLMLQAIQMMQEKPEELWFTVAAEIGGMSSPSELQRLFINMAEPARITDLLKQGIKSKMHMMVDIGRDLHDQRGDELAPEITEFLTKAFMLSEKEYHDPLAFMEGVFDIESTRFDAFCDNLFGDDFLKGPRGLGPSPLTP